MNTYSINLSAVVMTTAKATAYGLLLLTLSGCLISPFDGQKFESRSSLIPFTLYTTDKTSPVTIECAESAGYGSTPVIYHLVSTISPSPQGVLDPSGNLIYTASAKAVLPEICYRHGPYEEDYNYIASIRVLQGGSDDLIFTFDKTGLECLGKAVAEQANWYAPAAHCHRKFTVSNDPRRKILIRARW